MDKIEKILTPHQMEYRQVKVVLPHCSVCKEKLMGNGSVLTPYSCSCGEWTTDLTKAGYYRVRPKRLSEA